MPLFAKVVNSVRKTVGAAVGDPQSQSLKTWQDRLEKARQAARPDLELMDWREDLYSGSRAIQPGANSRATVARKASTVRNITGELIESQVDCTIPMPKVDPTDPKNEPKALMIEQMLRSDMNRLPSEYINDEQERTSPIQGGSWFLVEWDNGIRTHTTAGDTVLTLLHPKQVFLQPGAQDVAHAQYGICQFSVTKEHVRDKYGVDVDGEAESNPEIAVASQSAGRQADTGNVTLNLAYYKNGKGGIGLFGWVNDVAVVDFEDYQARRLDVCVKCGREWPIDGDSCACGGRRWKTEEREFETLEYDIPLMDGRVIPAMSPVLDEDGRPVTDGAGNPAMTRTKLPYYKPNALPLVLRKNVSAYGKLLGESDVDKIADLQERVKKLGTKIDEKLLKGGSYITLPRNVSFEMNDTELKVIRVRSPADLQAISVQTLQPNISYDSMELDKAVLAAKETLGISASFQGLPDTTATSGVAKQFSASRTSSRLESKRRMKEAAWADVYELMFKFKLAYADEPRPYLARDATGRRVYGRFSRYEFLERDAAGQWYFDDRYLFSVDATSAMANNRETLWQETRMNYQSGAFGQPGSPDSLVLFWTLMESLHYPKASEIKSQLQQATQQQQQQQMQAQAMQAQAQQAQAGQGQPRGPGGAPVQGV